LEKLPERGFELIYDEESSWIYGGSAENREINGFECSAGGEESGLKAKTINI
jgi:hypothetical protein